LEFPPPKTLPPAIRQQANDRTAAINQLLQQHHNEVLQSHNRLSIKVALELTKAERCALLKTENNV
jgi:hypothetical protein